MKYREKAAEWCCGRSCAFEAEYFSLSQRTYLLLLVLGSMIVFSTEMLRHLHHGAVYPAYPRL